MTAKNFEQIWNEIDTQNQKRYIMKSLFYPLSREVKRETASIQVEYECDEDECDFTPVMDLIHHSKELKSFHSNHVLQSFMSLLKQHPEDFIPSRMDAFVFHKCGIPFLSMKRKGDPSGRSVGLNYNDLRDHYYKDLFVQKTYRQCRYHEDFINFFRG